MVGEIRRGKEKRKVGIGILLPASPFRRVHGWALPTAHLLLVSLEDEHEGQGQAHGEQGHEEHTHPVVPQGKHLASGVDVGPHHHIENLRETGERARSGIQWSNEAAPFTGRHLWDTSHALLRDQGLTGPGRDRLGSVRWSPCSLSIATVEARGQESSSESLLTLI